ncbi:MAG: HAD-IC family P-type ATPase [bacterium]
MKQSTKPYKETLKAFPSILARHVFLFVNGIIFSVVVLLFVFGVHVSAIVLGVITVINIILGVTQDTRSKYSLEKLQLITALKFHRIAPDGADEEVYGEELQRGDQIKIKLGDQIPIDGKVIQSSNLETSSALITGESDSFAKKINDTLFAGEIVTAGSGTVLLESTFNESKIAQMTNAIKKYSGSQSPIQESISKIIKISGFVLTAIIFFVVGRGYAIHQSNIEIVNNIGALASMVIPQGLVVITTLLFAFGAASYSSKHVLFQEINATEKLGRIKNLCMDKTGTLTSSHLVVEKIFTNEKYTEEEAKKLTHIYINGSGDVSKTVNAIAEFVDHVETNPVVLNTVPFSSWRGFGSIFLDYNGAKTNIFLGPPEVFLKRVSDTAQASWLQKITEEYTQKGDRVLCLASAVSDTFLETIEHIDLSIIAIYVLSSSLREGIRESIDFFQKRGVAIRIITGDNPETAVSVARAAGVNNPEQVITGDMLKTWTDDDYLKNSKTYSIFARILPEQKVKIIDALKQDGFTAMVGDGANDALAIKKADLGIAMFDGVPATRRLAGVILMNNSFAALPGAVELADSFICNIEILGSLFLNQALIGTFFFIFVSVFGYAYPILPLNITVTNYFTIGIPGMLIAYWALNPSGKIGKETTDSFIKKVLPFPLFSAILQASMMISIFMILPASVRVMDSNMFVLYALIISGFIFFVCTPRVYLGFISRIQKIHFLILFACESILLYILLHIPFVVKFFSLKNVILEIGKYQTMFYIVVGYLVLQYIFTMFFVKYFTKKIV